jgi:hypothetical protein
MAPAFQVAIVATALKMGIAFALGRHAFRRLLFA